MNQTPTESRRSRPLRDFALIGALVLLVVGLVRLPTLAALTAHSQLHTAANNAAHLPLFGVVALVLFALSRIVFRTRFSKQATHYWVAFGMAAVLAAGTELVQFFGPRDADLGDVLRNLIGAGAALGVLATVDRGMAGTRIQRLRLKRMVQLGATLTLVLVSVPVLLWAEAYRQRDERFPTLSGFDSYWEKKFLINVDSKLTLTSPPARWNAPGSGRVGRWSSQSGASPTLRLIEPYPDWRGYESLNLSLYSIEDDSVRISIIIRDARYTGEFTDCFTGRYVLQPGSNEIEIALDDVRTSPKTREMEMSAIVDLMIYSHRTAISFTLYVDDLRLVSRVTADSRPAAE